jgi:hemoglobin/transferrin/lactoferrin receptor protein
MMTSAAFHGVPAAAQTITFTGMVNDSRTHRPIDGAMVSVIETHTRSTTDSAGMFRLALPAAGRYTLSVRRIGYAASECIAAAAQGASVVIGLHPTVIQADEVIIRSTRIQSSSLNSSPIPLSVLTGEEISLHPSATAADAIAKIPGITLVRDGPWETAVSIRGMSRSNIVMMIDNTRIETANDIAGAFSLVDLDDLERVEVVRSPGSSLWGSGAIGGVVHMMTRQPSFSDTPDSHLQIDERAASVDGLVSHHVAFDQSSSRIGFRLGLGYRNAGNTQTPDGAIPNSQFTDMNVGTSMGVRTYDAQTLYLSYQRSQAENTGIPGGAAFASQARARYTMARRELASAEYSMPDLSRALGLLTFRLSHQTIERDVEVIQTPTLTLTPHAMHTTSSAQIESRLQPLADLTLTAGIDAWQRSLESRRERANSAAHTITEERPVPSSAYFSAGSYLHGVWKPSPDRVTIDAGARYDLIRVTNETTFNPEYVLGPAGIPDMQPPGQTVLWNAQSVDNHSWSADAGVTVALSPDAEISCLAAAAFRSPSLEERFQFLDLGSLVRVGSPLLKPEQSTSLNAAMSVHRGGSSARIDLFINKFTDLVTEIPGVFEGRSALVKTNIGEALMYGGELAADHSLLDWVSASYSLAYVHGEDTRAHAPLPQIPPLTGNVSLNASMPSAIMLSIGASYAFRQDRIAPGEAATPGSTVVDVDCSSGSLPLPLLSHACTLRGGIGNVFNASYRLHVSTLRGLIQREPGRNFYLSVSIAVL